MCGCLVIGWGVASLIMATLWALSGRVWDRSRWREAE